MLISLPRDESTILLMDLHLTKILAVGKPNFIEVNTIINIARSALDGRPVLLSVQNYFR